MTLLEVEQSIEEIAGQRVMFKLIPEKSDWTPEAKKYTIHLISPETLKQIIFTMPEQRMCPWGWARVWQPSTQSHSEMLDQEIRKLYSYLISTDEKWIVTNY